jgi:hypothetical protein
MTNKEHKIFERMLDIDLKTFHEYLIGKYIQMLNNELPEENELNEILLKKYNMHNNMSGQLNQKYNVFKFKNKDIKTLYDQIKLCTKEACTYYGYEFDDMDYRIRGWFNFESKTEKLSHDPLINQRLYHDHLGGYPAPDFHGYYCVNAEPSSTYYKISDDLVYENKNINNRLILAENGYPHSRGNWFNDNPRITIAYDVVPFKRLVQQGIDKRTHWMRFE